MTRDPAAAEDLVGEAFLRLARELAAGRRPDNPSAWVAQVARHLAISRARRASTAARLAPRLVDRGVGEDPAIAALASERAAAVHTVLESLPPVERLAIVLAAEGVRGPGDRGPASGARPWRPARSCAARGAGCAPARRGRRLVTSAGDARPVLCPAEAGMTELALIGRADELELAGAMLRRARDGTPGLLVVGGEAGVGRSRLAAAIAAEAVATGVRTATGTCVRMDAGALTYAAIITALRSLAADADPGEVARTLGAYRHEVAPAAARARPARAPTRHRPDDDPMARLRLFEAITGWLNRMADGDPLLLIVEDLQWADAATLDLLRALAVGLTGRTSLVVTLRTDQALPPAVRATVAELVRDGAERVELVPFRRDELDRPGRGGPRRRRAGG